MSAETSQPASSFVTTFVLALWAGVVGGMLVATVGFANPHPLQNAGLYLATLALTTIALIATFTSPRRLISRGTQLGVTLSLIFHTGLAVALSQTDLRLAELNAAGAAVRDNMTPPAPPTLELVDVHQSEPRPTPLFEKPVDSESLVRTKAEREKRLATVRGERLQPDKQIPNPAEPSLAISLSKPQETTFSPPQRQVSLAPQPQLSPLKNRVDDRSSETVANTPAFALNRQATRLSASAIQPEVSSSREPLAEKLPQLEDPRVAQQPSRRQRSQTSRNAARERLASAAYKASEPTAAQRRPQTTQTKRGPQKTPQLRASSDRLRAATRQSSSVLRTRMAAERLLPSPEISPTNESVTADEDRFSPEASLADRTALAGSMTIDTGAPATLPETGRTRGARPAPTGLTATTPLPLPQRSTAQVKPSTKQTDRLVRASSPRRSAPRGTPPTTRPALVAIMPSEAMPASQSPESGKLPDKDSTAEVSSPLSSLRPIDITQKNPLRRPQRYAMRGALSASSLSSDRLPSSLSSSEPNRQPSASENRERRPAIPFAQREKRPLEQERRSPAPGSGEPTPLTEAAIERGLAYLNQQQKSDGSWTFSNPDADAAAGPSFRADAAATGLALLSFLGAGYDHFGADAPGRYRQTIQRGLDYLVSQQAPSGELFPEAGDEEAWQVARFYSHGIASLALCEAYGMTGDPALQAAAQKALNYLKRTQVNGLGGWRYTPGVNADLSVTGWQVMALRSGQLAGLRVSPETLSRAEYFVELCREKSGRRVRFCYNPKASADDPRTQHGRNPGTVMTSVGLLLKMYLGANRNAAQMQLGANHLLENLPTAGDSKTPARTSTLGNPLRDTYYWYYATQVMFHMGGYYWQAWNEALHPMLVATQVNGTSLHGSWNPATPTPDKWSQFGGRHYVTTMNLLSLEVYYRHLPLYENE